MSKVGVQVRRLWGGRLAREPASVAAAADLSVMSAVTRRGLDDLERQVDRLELKLNGMLLALVGAALAEIYRAATR